MSLLVLPWLSCEPCWWNSGTMSLMSSPSYTSSTEIHHCLPPAARIHKRWISVRLVRVLEDCMSLRRSPIYTSSTEVQHCLSPAASIHKRWISVRLVRVLEDCTLSIAWKPFYTRTHSRTYAHPHTHTHEYTNTHREPQTGTHANDPSICSW